MNNITRREFLLLAGLTAINSAYIFKDIDLNNNSNKIYSLTDYIHLAKYSADTEDGKAEFEGMGFIMDGKYITCNHIPARMKIKTTTTPFGSVEDIRKIENEEAYIGNIRLTELVRDEKSDIAIYDSYGYLPDFPCKPCNDINLGDEVYIIGNPGLKGHNIRKSKISDLDGLDGLDVSDYCFGIGKALIGGDSGTPIVNSDYELLGMNTLTAFGQLGYATKIKHILDKL